MKRVVGGVDNDRAYCSSPKTSTTCKEVCALLPGGGVS